jgi:hypothetical protein
MRSAVIAVAAVATLTLYFSSGGVRGQIAIHPRCLHDADETPVNRIRREQALALARAINAAQGQAVERTRAYQPLNELGALPATPEGFVLRLYAGQDGYIFSIKDDRDACRYGIFSDQHGTLYQSSPTVPLIAS